MNKMIRIDKGALRVILGALYAKTNKHFDVNEIEFVSASNTRLGYAVLFRSYQYTADIVIAVYTDTEDDLRYISTDVLYYEDFEELPIDVDTIKMTYTKLRSLIEE